MSNGKSLSNHYVTSPSMQYHVAAVRVAIKIMQSRPAVDTGDQAPTFNAAACSTILAEAFCLPRADVLKDLIELSKRV